MQSVYSPQVDDGTAIERIRWGRVYGRLSDLAAVISNSAGPAPLVLPDVGARLGLATALCALFRTKVLPGVEAKFLAANDADTDVVQRISAIHRQLAALHEELADLTVAAARTAPSAAPAAKAATQRPPAPARAVGAATAPAITEHQRMQAHLVRSFKNVNGSAEAAATALEQAWLFVLRDPQLHGETGISVSLFGSVGTQLVKQHGSLSEVLGMQLRKWCVQQARAAGLAPSDVPGTPSNLRVR